METKFQTQTAQVTPQGNQVPAAAVFTTPQTAEERTALFLQFQREELQPLYEQLEAAMQTYEQQLKAVRTEYIAARTATCSRKLKQTYAGETQRISAEIAMLKGDYSEQATARRTELTRQLSEASLQRRQLQLDAGKASLMIENTLQEQTHILRLRLRMEEMKIQNEISARNKMFRKMMKDMQISPS